MQDENGYTALHWACLLGSYQSVRLLLAKGANPNAMTKNCKSSPLILAVKTMEET